MNRLDDYGYEKFEENVFPLAYLITFRTLGSWLPGDERGSVDRNKYNVYGCPDRPANKDLEDITRWRTGKPVLIDTLQRKIVEDAIVEVCDRRCYVLHAVNARSNHVHAVVSAAMKPERIADSFKAYSTRRLRKFGHPLERVWSRGRSRSYLWKPQDVVCAIDYVLYQQDGSRSEIMD